MMAAVVPPPDDDASDLPEGAWTAAELLDGDGRPLDSSPAAIAGVLGAGHLGLLVGQPKKTAKTMLGAELIVRRLLLGGRWLGADVTPHEGIAVAPTETRPEEFASRVAAFARGHGCSPKNVADVLRRTIVISRPLPPVSRDACERLRQGFVAAQAVDKLRGIPSAGRRDVHRATQFARYGDTTILDYVRSLQNVALLFLDSFGFHAGVRDENSAAEVGPAVRAYRELAEDLDAPAILVHHAAKDGRGGSRTRGSGAFEADADCIISLTPKRNACIAAFTLRSFPEREPVTYALHAEGDTLAFRCPHLSSASAPEEAPDPAMLTDVRAVLASAVVPLTAYKIRTLVQERRGRPGKANATSVTRALRALESEGVRRYDDSNVETFQLSPGGSR